LFFPAIGLGEAALKGLVLLLKADDAVLELIRIRCLGGTHSSRSQQPEGGGDSAVLECGTHGRGGKT
jgi:hypothetical protein